MVSHVPLAVRSLDGADIAVMVSGAALIAGVLWYFFGSRQRTAAPANATGVQEIRVIVKGGYAPDVIVVKRNQPVRLDFYRDETASCTERVHLPELGIAKELPAFRTTPVKFTPTRAGELTFTCGMSMIRGKIVVEEA